MVMVTADPRGRGAPVRAVALVGFYRGELVQPGQVIELPAGEFHELRGMHKVDYAPPEPAKPADDKPAEKKAGT